MQRILFIAYFYPPLGGPAVQRPLKTIKYLKQAGFYVDVLTVGDIQFHSYDHSLLEESQADHIYRVKSHDVMSMFTRFRVKKSVGDAVYFGTPERFKKIVRGMFIIDDKIGWLSPAYKYGLSLIKTNTYDCILATVGPLTAGMVALKLHKKTKLPFYVDYRDLMSLRKYSTFLTKLQKNITAHYEKKMLTAATGAFFVGSKLRDIMIDHFGDFLSPKSTVVYNGYDESDFTDTIAKTPTNIRYIRFVGNIYGHTSVEFFIQALTEMVSADEIPENICFEFIGNYYTETLKWLNTDKLKPFIHIHPQCTHSEAIVAMLSSDLLLLFISTQDGEEYITGKVFEYIRSQRPILAMVSPRSEVAGILRELGHQYICNMEDVASIKGYLRDFFSGKPDLQLHFSDTYSRENQTNNIINMLNNDCRK